MPRRTPRVVWESGTHRFRRARPTPAETSNTGFVYIVQAPGIGVKIGFSTNPVARLPGIQTGCPVKVHIVGLILGDRLLEKMLHQRLANYRLSGEWFDEAVLPLLMRIVADPSIVEAAA